MFGFKQPYELAIRLFSKKAEQKLSYSKRTVVLTLNDITLRNTSKLDRNEIFLIYYWTKICMRHNNFINRQTLYTVLNFGNKKLLYTWH